MCRRAPTPLGPHPQQPIIQLQKPSLARRLVGSARINLNDYWNVFEAIMDPSSANIENENSFNERRLAKLTLEEHGISSNNSTTTQTNKNSPST